MIASLGYSVLVVAGLAALAVVGFLAAAALNAWRKSQRTGCELCDGIAPSTLRRWGACPDCGRSGGVL